MADEGIRTVKIRKSSFKFGLRKRYSYEKKYRKPERTPLDQIRQSFFKKKEPKGAAAAPGAAAGAAAEEEKPQAPPLVSGSLIRKIGGAVLLAVLFFATFIILGSSTVIPEQITLNGGGAPSIAASLLSTEILTASEQPDWRAPVRTAYARILLDGTYSGNVSAEVYNDVFPSAVYVLDSPRYQAESYPEFISELKRLLLARGILLNDIGIDELRTIPPQSLILVPSGYVPEQLLVDKGSKLDDLLGRGVTVVYLGQPFDLMYNRAGSVVAGNTKNIENLRITFTPSASLSCNNNTAMKSPLYSFGGDTHLVFGCISVLKGDTTGTGSFIALPQTLDGGWDNGTAAAQDVYALISTTPWLSPIASFSQEIPAMDGNSTEMEIFTSTFEGDGKYVHIHGEDNQSGTTGFSKVAYVQKSTLGDIYTLGHNIAPAAVAPTTMDIIVDLRESGGEERLFLVVRNSTNEIDRHPVATTKVALNSKPTFEYTFNLTTGDYILSVEDANGKSYARSYMRAGVLRIVMGAPDYGGDRYPFSFFLDENPINLTGKAYVDNGQKYVDFTNANSILVEAAALSGGPLEANKPHIITFQTGGESTEVGFVKVRAATLFDNPIFIAAIVFAALAFGIGFFFARKGEIIYGLDIPDFPPQLTKKIPMKKEALLSIFEKINVIYKWKNTPLKLAEIKGGFKGMLYEGKPVFISDYNLEFVLSTLVSMGLLKKEMEYYGVSLWEKDTGKPMKQLAFFRKLRDICINNAIPFTQLSKEEGYDSRITIIGQDMFIHLYDSPDRVIPDVLSSLSKGLNVVVFEDEAEKNDFYEYISNGNREAAILKLEVQAGSVLLKTWDEFTDMVKEMKV